ncbi:glycosyltransferase [Pseudomonas matsuisoli]|uniref:Colanic acid biosynthesis glycosyltransferase WcaE n=1 Tax=Pseudomonas matsuisoli TaxID=1515666 RepID=A0A917UXH4_9PSED|nr:glycosyltransferase [Pseudomonas matsuisoli]GGJ93166.1 colanic acid biosynthesis glycosyltransferase WcaE [Pseudomonas matsuisoli]
MALFSIVTINWNNLAGLEKTYRSVASQTCKDYRWIVVDGASTDGGVEWLNALNDPHAEITSEKDKGIYDAMNKGLERSTLTDGYTLFMNSGDTFADEHVLEKVANAIKSAPKRPRFVWGDYYTQREDSPTRAHTAKDADKLWVGMLSSHQAMYFENQRLRQQQTRFREKYRLSADYCMLIEFVKDIPRDELLKLSFPLCVFDMTGISETQRFAALKEDMQIRRLFLKLSSPHSFLLYLLHYAHTHTKMLRANFGR